MLTVTIDVCGDPIKKIHALRIKGEAHENCVYQLYDENMIPFRKVNHHYDHGAEALAIIMLNCYRGYQENDNTPTNGTPKTI